MLYNFLAFLFPLIFKCIFNLRIIGAENIPAEGPVIIASNHVSLLDPPLLGVAAKPRKVHFMAKQELFFPVFGTIIKALGAFPVHRGAYDRAALKTAIAILKSNKALAIFPEGTRSKTGTLGHAGPGTVMIAAQTQACIIPAAIIGSDLKSKSFLRPNITIAFGKPIIFEDAEKPDKAAFLERTELLMHSIAQLITKNSARGI